MRFSYLEPPRENITHVIMSWEVRAWSKYVGNVSFSPNATNDLDDFFPCLQLQKCSSLLLCIILIPMGCCLMQCGNSIHWASHQVAPCTGLGSLQNGVHCFSMRWLRLPTKHCLYFHYQQLFASANYHSLFSVPCIVHFHLR